MAGIFGEFFLVSISHETKHEKFGKFRAKFGAKFGTKIRKIRGTFVLQRFRPNKEEPTRKLRHASVLRTRSDTQAAPAFDCMRTQSTLPDQKYYDVVIYNRRSNSLFVEISCEFSPGKQGYRRSVLLPP